MANLGFSYWNGDCMPKNKNLAVHLLSKSANAGHAPSLSILARINLQRGMRLIDLLSGADIADVESADTPESAHARETRRHSANRELRLQEEALRKQQDAELDRHMEKLSTP